MKKLLVLLWFVVVIVALGIAPAMAAPASELTALARYYPEETAVFAAVRTDDRFFQLLDSLAARVASRFPQGTIPPVSLRTLLDIAAQQVTGKDFAAGVRSWLGDTAAIGLTSLEGMNQGSPPLVLAASVTNRSAAEDFWIGLLSKNGAFTQTTGENYTLLGPDMSRSGFRGNVLISDDVLLLSGPTTDVAGLFSGTGAANLSRNVVFNETLAMLPAGEYSAVAYANTGDFLGLAMQMNMPADAANALPFDPAAIGEAVGSQALGITVLDDRSLVVDVASNPANVNALYERMGLRLMPTGSVDPAFAAHIPANASLVVHATNFKALYDNLLETIRFAMAMSGQPNGGEQIDQGLAIARATLKSVMGLDLDEDILGWMTGDYALFISFDMETIIDEVAASMESAIMGEFNPLQFDELPVGFGLVVEAGDPAKAKGLVARLGQVLPRLAAQAPTMQITQEQIDGADVVVVSQPQAFMSGMVPFEFVIGANDQVLVMATRPAATDILTGAPGLPSARAYQEAGRYFLKDATSITYIDSNGVMMVAAVPMLALLGPSIGNIFERIAKELEQGGSLSPTKTPEEIERERQEQLAQQRQQVEVFRALTRLFSSASITVIIDADGNSVTRIVVTLAE